VQIINTVVADGVFSDFGVVLRFRK